MYTAKPKRSDLGKYFNIDRIIDLSEGAVIIDLMALDAFYAQTHNSRKGDLIRKRVKMGEIIPLNADALGDMATNHAMLHAQIYQSGMDLPTIPTLINFNGSPMTLGSYQPSTIPGIYVHKKSGEEYSHGGKGVSIINASEIKFTEKPFFELIQPFILPPFDENRDRFVVDTRVFIVGNKAVAGISRKASKPLTARMINGKEIPTGDYFPTADHPGTIELPASKLWKKVAHQAEKIADFLALKMQAFPNRLYSTLSPVGFASFDFLLDSQGEPLLVDFDLQPMVREQVLNDVAVALKDYAISLATVDGSNKKIIVIGDERTNIVQKLLTELTNSTYSENVIQQYLSY